MTTYSWIQRRSILWLVPAVVIATASGSAAQSLGDVAQREAERRKQVTSGRTYTNADLAAVDPVQAPPAVAAVASTTAPTESTPDTGESGQGAAATESTGTEKTATSISGSQKRDEPYWRSRAKDLRGRLAQTNAHIAALEARLAEMDGTPQTPALAQERVLVAATLERLRSDAGYRQQEVAQLEGRARIENVPPDWIR